MTDTAIQENPQWEAIVRQVDTGDRVLGGADGAVNIAYRQLANRTSYLKQQITELNAALPGNATAKTAGLVKLINTLNSTVTDAALTAAQGKALNDAITKLNELLTGYSSYSLLPTGAVFFYLGETAPSGSLKMNGAAISRTLYANLFALIGTRYGAGDGHSTYNLPDARGEFPRFWDDGRGVDVGRGLGTWQGDAIRNITAQMYLYGQDGSSSQGAFGFRKQGERGLVWSRNDNNAGVVMDFWLDASKVVPTAHENRPRNIALLACIKY
ncbi:phage tail protein [Kingella oralis]|jgi:hypothetical protein|uniref:Phage Tail Collar Domain protein n=1 Tax=Kingella oralis ATCC 51147 TaxID=629741 RepID=C4GGG9_9NEIS|nr:phage tail protein [Kingella oralis]EEP69324.1 phage Tail Collar Domain protein [Kingella oralis ATCC 51147]QMT43855.1 tail fiber protein [Kingella oralis]DAL03218.1 MAG TPA: tail collar fiber protein [Caudoviricetes sp.]